MDATEIIELIKQDPQVVSMALSRAADEYDYALHDHPNDPDAEQWKLNVELLNTLAEMIY